MSKQMYIVISREAAAIKQLKLYFTGEPCKRGHLAPRYVLNGACLDCLHRHRIRLHPSRRDKIPFNGAQLYRSRRLDTEQLDQLGEYLQKCIDAFEAQLLSPICQTCDGTKYVPKGDGTANWKLCPDCQTSELAP